MALDTNSFAQAHLKPLVEAGVKGFKCFLIESGVEVCFRQFCMATHVIHLYQEFPCVSETDLRMSMEVLQVSSSTLGRH